MLKNTRKQLIPTTYKLMTHRFNEKVLMQIANNSKIRILEQTIHNPHYIR